MIKHVFNDKFDITWAFDFIERVDLDPNRRRSEKSAQAISHIVGERLWDKLPIENITVDHEKDCKNYDILLFYIFLIYFRHDIYDLHVL